MASTNNGLALAQPATATTLNLEIRSAEDLQRLARLFAASGLFGRSGGNPEAHMAECAIKILAGMEAGFGPFASASGVSVINGKTGFGANLLAQAVKRHPLYDYRVLEKTDKICRIKFLAGKEELGVETFTIEMAKRAGLTKDGGMYSKYPEAMLFSRCLSAGMRTHCPDALGGAPAYTPEELGAVGEVDEDGVVTATVVVEAPSRDELQVQAIRKLKSAGLTGTGTAMMLRQLAGPDATGIGQLDDSILQRFARDGAPSRCIQAWNNGVHSTTGELLVDPKEPEEFEEAEEDKELPAAWDLPPEPAA